MITLGLDVHVRNSYFHAIDDRGKVVGHGRRSNSPEQLTELIQSFKGDAVQASLENTTNSRALHRFLTAAAKDLNIPLQAQVLDARKLRIIAESVSKCDRLDAAVIAELTRADFKLPKCYLPDDEEFALREHLRARHDLVRLRTNLKNRTHSVLHRRGILTPSNTSLFTEAGYNYLAQQPLDDAGRTIINRYLDMIAALDDAINESTRDVRGLSREPRWNKPAALLQSMPGIGLTTAMTILAELGDVHRFRSRAAVANYVGLVPVLRSSNEKRFSGGITKRGSKHLRAVLVEAAWGGYRRVPEYDVAFQRIAARRGKSVAIVAIARRMLEIAWIMLKKDDAFRFSQSVAG
ncbi:MAG: IS110 family RNA-guided transposase [Planctomycetota bacterium]|jgi:transposase